LGITFETGEFLGKVLVWLRGEPSHPRRGTKKAFNKKLWPRRDLSRTEREFPVSRDPVALHRESTEHSKLKFWISNGGAATMGRGSS